MFVIAFAVPVAILPLTLIDISVVSLKLAFTVWLTSFERPSVDILVSECTFALT